MMSHGGWEDSSDWVTKDAFFRKVIFELSLKIRRSQPFKALEEEYSRLKEHENRVSKVRT